MLLVSVHPMANVCNCHLTKGGSDKNGQRNISGTIRRAGLNININAGVSSCCPTENRSLGCMSRCLIGGGIGSCGNILACQKLGRRLPFVQ